MNGLNGLERDGRIPEYQAPALAFAVFPLVIFTASKLKMGPFVNPLWLKLLAFLIAGLIASLNLWLLVQFFTGA